MTNDVSTAPILRDFHKRGKKETSDKTKKLRLLIKLTGRLGRVDADSVIGDDRTCGSRHLELLRGKFKHSREGRRFRYAQPEYRSQLTSAVGTHGRTL